MNSYLKIWAIGLVCWSVALEARGSCPQSFAALKQPSIESLRHQFAFFREIGEQDNIAFRSLAEKANKETELEGKESGAEMLFLDMENAVMKDLNDQHVRDKDVVTALVNFHKTVFWKAITDDPVLMRALVGKYSDPKSIRLAFNQNSPEIVAHLQAAYQSAGAKYEEEILRLPDSRTWFKNTRGLAASAFNWHLSGYGPTPDIASAVARDARTATPTGARATLRGFGEAEGNLIRNAAQSDLLRTRIAARWASVPKVMSKSEKGNYVLSVEAINTIRKAAPAGDNLEEYITAVRADFLAHFKVRLDRQEILDFRDYIQSSDAFSPAIYMDRRVEVELAKARYGVVSMDLKAQNARNIEGTMKALADTEGAPIPDRIVAVRAAEAKVTAGLDANKRTISKMGDSRGGISQFTGDDGAYFPDHELSPEEKRTIARQLNKRVGLNRTRLVFLPQRFYDTGREIPAEQRSQWIVAAENAEKKLQKALVKTFGPRASEISVAFDIKASEHGRGLGVYMSLPDGQRPSANLQAETKRILTEMGWRVRTVQVP